MTDSNRRALGAALLGGAVALAALAIGLALHRSRRGPAAHALEGAAAPELIAENGLGAFAQRFDRDPSTPVLLAVLTPTAVTDARALQTFLADFSTLPIRVLVVWEPRDDGDHSTPAPDAWKLLTDGRVEQRWDPLAQVSAALLRQASGAPSDARVVDYAAAFKPGAKWVPPGADVVFHGSVTQVLRALHEAFTRQEEALSGGSAMPSSVVLPTPDGGVRALLPAPRPGSAPKR